MYKFISGNSESPLGKAIIYARLKFKDSSPSLSYWENPSTLISLGDSTVLWGYISSNPIDFTQKTGLDSREFAEAKKVAIEDMEEALAENPGIPGYSTILPFVFNTTPNRLEKLIPFSKGIEDLIFTGSTHSPAIARSMIMSAVSMYGQDCFNYNQYLGKQDPWTRKVEPIGEDLAETHLYTRKSLKEIVLDEPVSSFLMREYVVPIIDGLRNQRNNEVDRLASGLINLGEGYSRPEDFRDLAKAIQSSKGDIDGLNLIDFIVKKIEAVHCENFELARHYQRLIESGEND